MKQLCKDCKTKADCKHAFGMYWAYKSNMGQGCDHPFAYNPPPKRTPLPLPTRKLIQRTLP